MILQYRADIWKHLGLSLRVDSDGLREYVEKLTVHICPSSVTASIQRQSWDSAGESPRTDREPPAAQTYGLAVAGVMNMSEVGRHVSPNTHNKPSHCCEETKVFYFYFFALCTTRQMLYFLDCKSFIFFLVVCLLPQLKFKCVFYVKNTTFIICGHKRAYVSWLPLLYYWK